MIDGIWWLVILLAVVASLWLLAYLRGAKSDDKTKASSRAKISPNDGLQKTAAMLKQYFPDYRVSRKNNHLLVIKQGKKIAMITIDKKLATGQRRLGDVPIINYHRTPSRAQLSTNLQDAE
ncbi:hypothetical protein [Psychrobacter sp. LV10R520-6]|uniref:hypothetical protein n=1 Tax=Psychrobacter sp. LV10R520-6 TaxID=1415574 RepID=UPI0024C6B6FB|nr:hypothetical protein [Psychrobacter sp. LV10R520-6]SNT69089.1 hypothetical protein SAMN04488491_0144 [Psychrobacter sp. LV10R520-6]